ncbi:envelope stress response membrane protein PspB [Pleionea litopenaei]|uniref:Envelope stress response membrane protein PspB n=1 Tax=Pleionea litopenaei TaxID=3070815 RepID=A0AA51RW25_9GAMM|nr:envelope stress response membrane protein PspB [Pleionea sp. HL-JVS1]WMS88564.1 envelope stress response membrane protein PspB [Pleionea sp. HL-JVS1]
MSDEVMFILGAIFLVVVVPYWLKLHYRGEKNTKSSESKVTNKSTSTSEPEKVEQLHLLAEQLTERVKNLESILDDKAPGWRTNHGR